MAAVDELEAVLPVTRSSEALMRINAPLAHRLLDDLGEGFEYDELFAVTPPSRSPVANAHFSTVLGKRIIAVLRDEGEDPDPG
jgi:hypothetical protein